MSIQTCTDTLEKAEAYIQGKTFTGTAYYVSNSGSDYNSGISPDSPWATLEKINNTRFSRGDAIFFELGGTWYGNIVTNVDDISLSAYGEGAKPVISGNEPGVCLAERWREYGKTVNGGTVWIFENAYTDTAQVLLGEERQPALRFCPDVKDGIFINEAGEEFDPLKELTQDLSFFCKADLNCVDITQSLSDVPRPAEVYLRCDAGNPAESFSCIEFMYSHMGI